MRKTSSQLPFGSSAPALARFALLLLCFGCKPWQKSMLSDIYRDDASSETGGNSRRHAASEAEMLWTVHSPGCSAILLNPRTVLTANHCKAAVGETMRSGWSVATGGTDDLTVSAVLESSASLDYKILQVRWLTPQLAPLKYPPRIATQADDVFCSLNADQGDELFTVGFPDDRTHIWSSTYAEGQAKQTDSQSLYFNIGIINGNSGGGVLKKESHMLVSLANGGAHNLGESGWDKADKNLSKDWNYGTALWQIYSESKILPQLFPQGINAEYAGSFQAKTQIYLFLTEELGPPSLWLAASDQTERILLCPGTLPVCQESSPGAELLNPSYRRNGRSFFLSSQTAESRPVFTAAAVDKSGSLIGQRHIQLTKDP